jgi:hypothetical protein
MQKPAPLITKRPAMLYFIRHAQSLANIGGTTPDATQIPLTEQGWQAIGVDVTQHDDDQALSW